MSSDDAGSAAAQAASPANPPSGSATADLQADEPDDGTLMADYAGGNAGAFEQLHARHHKALYRYLRNSCGNDAHAQELYQDVWLKVIRHRLRYRQDAPFKAWLYRIARNRLVDHYRQQPPISALADVEVQVNRVSAMHSAPLAPDEIASLRERADVLERALQTLPEVQREALLLRHIAGMSIREVATVVDEGMQTVKSRLRYATVKLRSQLQELM